MKSMKGQPFSMICFIASMSFLGLIGCNKDSGPPPPLPVEQIPAAMQKSFNSAEPEARDIVGRLTSALRTNDYPAAYQEVQSLCSLPGETRAQRTVAARALLTITGLLQTAQAQGDERSANALKLRQMSR
jgi:hypothetical protein